MTPDEYELYQVRVREYDAAVHDITRYEKLEAMLEAISEDKEWPKIVIDTEAKCFKYMSGRSENIRSICSLSPSDHEHLYASFMTWAHAEISQLLEAAKQRKLET